MFAKSFIYRDRGFAVFVRISMYFLIYVSSTPGANLSPLSPAIFAFSIINHQLYFKSQQKSLIRGYNPYQPCIVFLFVVINNLLCAFIFLLYFPFFAGCSRLLNRFQFHREKEKVFRKSLPSCYWYIDTCYRTSSLNQKISEFYFNNYCFFLKCVTLFNTLLRIRDTRKWIQ